jgi:hypothetical protein
VTSPLPPNFTEIVFAALYPEHTLITMPGDIYAVRVQGGLLAADSIGSVCRMLAELHKDDIDVSYGVNITLPHRR